jgi:hypothetical protein
VSVKPWTVQDRVADIAFLDRRMYFGLNGTGLATTALDESGKPKFAYFADPLIFGHRTITTLVPRQGTMTVHLYYNVLLNDATPQELSINGISLVSFLPDKSDYSFLIPPFQRRNVDWEAAGFAAESENSFAFEWKHTDTTETRFVYTRFHPDTRAEEPLSRDEFLAAMGVPSISGPDVPKDLAAFFAACKARIPGIGPDTVLQFTVRSRESPVRRGYRSRPESDVAVVVPVFEQAGVLSALLPDGTILSAPAGGAGAAAAEMLPALPAGYRYTDLVIVGDMLVVAWEEISFTDVGRAGLLLLRGTPGS